MPTDFRSASVECPFYITEDARNIICEGIYPKSRMIMAFNGREAKERHQSTYCFVYRSCRQCRLCGALYGKYEDTEE